MIYVFSQYVLDTQRRNLSCAGKPISLRPKAFEVLSYFLAHRDSVVSKQELCEQVWAGQSISDATLVSTVRAVRQAIGDNGEVQKLIATVHGYGYRCVAAVIVQAEGESALATEAQSVGLLPAFFPQLVADEEKATAPEPSSSAAVQRLVPVPSSSYEERKFVTVLCCGLGNTSDFLAQHNLDTLYSLMRGLYEQTRSTVQQYGGVLQPAMWHCIVAAFGAPMAQEDHAVRAALAALALRQRLTEWLHTTARRPDLTLAVRLGLHTGFIVVGDLGEESALTTALVGDVAAKAVTLQEQAEPGTVLCSKATARLVRAEVSLEVAPPAAETELWGQLYTVLDRRSRRVPGTQHTVRHVSPFVGREREMATFACATHSGRSGAGAGSRGGRRGWYWQVEARR